MKILSVTNNQTNNLKNNQTTFGNKINGVDSLVNVLAEKDWLTPKQLNILSNKLSHKLPNIKFPKGADIDILVGQPIIRRRHGVLGSIIEITSCPVTSSMVDNPSLAVES